MGQASTLDLAAKGRLLQNVVEADKEIKELKAIKSSVGVIYTALLDLKSPLNTLLG